MGLGRTTLVALALPFCAIEVAAEEGTYPGTFDFTYDGTANANGVLSGECTGALLNGNYPGKTELRLASPVEASTYTTSWNVTELRPTGGEPVSVQSHYQQYAQKILLPAGAYSLDWHASGRVRFYPGNWPESLLGENPEPLVVSLKGENLTAEMAMAPADPGQYFIRDQDGVVTRFVEGLGFAARRTDLQDGMFDMVGPATLFFENARLRGPGIDLILPPQSATDVANTSAVAIRHIEVKHFVAPARHVQWGGSSRDWLLACSSMEASIFGSLTAYAATGRLEFADRFHEFRLVDVTMEGEFHWSDEVEEAVWSHGSGQFTFLGADYRLVAPWPFRLDGPVVVATVAVAGLGLLLAGLACYSRFEKSTILKHSIRERIHLTVRENPWIHAAQLQRLTDIPESTLRYHVNQLRAHGLLTAAPAGPRLVRYYANESGSPIEAAPAAPPAADAVRSLVRRECGETSKPMAEIHRLIVLRLGYSSSGGWYALRRLVRDGQILETRVGRRRWIRCGE